MEAMTINFVSTRTSMVVIKSLLLNVKRLERAERGGQNKFVIIATWRIHLELSPCLPELELGGLSHDPQS